MLKNWCFRAGHAVPWAGLGWSSLDWSSSFSESPFPILAARVPTLPSSKAGEDLPGLPPGTTPPVGLQRGWRGQQGFPG